MGYMGGVVSRDIGGVIPSAASASPMSQNMISQFSAMTPEQLQETVQRVGPGSPSGQMAARVLQQKQMMPQQAQQPGAQSVTGAQPSADTTGIGIPHMADGGPPSGYWQAQIANPARQGNYGLLQSPMGAAGGRTDTLPHVVAADSYVIPADVVSGLGEGDTLSGAKAIDAMLHTMPYGISAPPSGRGRGIPAAPPANWRPPQPQAKGGKSNGRGAVPVIVANGEYVVHPDDVKRLGDGNYKRGHDVLDAFVKHVRKKTLKDIKGLPDPVK